MPSDTISRQDYLVELISENYREVAPFIFDDDLMFSILSGLPSPIIQPGGWLVSAERQEPQFFISILTDVEGENRFSLQTK